MESTKLAINKNRKLKVVLCYLGLVILIPLLVLPPILRLTIQEKEEIKETIVTILECTKYNETVKATFMNQSPQKIFYNIKGDYRKNKEADIVDDSIDSESEMTVGDETETTNIDVPITYNELLEKIYEYAEVIYDEPTDLTSLTITVSKIEGSKDYELIFSNISSQENYYKSQGFTCSKSTV